MFRIKRHQREADEERDDLEVEKDELKRLAAQYQLEKKKLDEIHQAEARHLMADNLKQIGDVHRMRHIQRQQEEVSLLVNKRLENNHFSPSLPLLRLSSSAECDVTNQCMWTSTL